MKGSFNKQLNLLIAIIIFTSPAIVLSQGSQQKSDCSDGLNFPCSQYIANRSTFDCVGYIGTCNKPATITPNRKQPCETFTKKTAGKDLLYFYCDYFQCDGDNVKVNNGPPPQNPPDIIHDGGLYNLGIIYHDSYTCYSNCCYTNSDHKFLAEVNMHSSCRNICCPTLEGYMAGDCSKGGDSGDDNNSPTPTPTPQETLHPVATPGDGIIENNELPDFEISNQ
jgi:hypothetical protein